MEQGPWRNIPGAESDLEVDGRLSLKGQTLSRAENEEDFEQQSSFRGCVLGERNNLGKGAEENA